MARKKGSDVAAKARQLKAADLRARGFTYRQIGNHLKITHTQAWRDVHAGFDAMNKELAEKVSGYVALELSRLELPMRALDKMLRNKELDEKAKCIAIETWRKLSESRRKLLGLDQPEKRELSGPDGGPVAIREVEIRLAREDSKREDDGK